MVLFNQFNKSYHQDLFFSIYFSLVVVFFVFERKKNTLKMLDPEFRVQ